ncbi:hypothetical protein JOF41_005728 [Saccharothrix coeruleofusca]|uniref:DUF4349 domain-containing protein n=1 Tax=Saccharothrix coeruleofusca TaxID=33919 RepID=UPI001AE362F2|nr:DUF4349 domain-containing protein [Saccharothrix coeruleofusca]MBP2339550.1 hypothetical protein [Saccharothrix coeruleofusca]
MVRRWGAAVVVAGLVSLAGCTAGSGGTADSGAAARVAEPPPRSAPEQSAPEQPAREQGSAKAGEVDPAARNRQLVRTARVDLRAGDVADALARVKDVGAAQGGFAEREDSSRDRASVTLRVPADRLDAALKAVDELGVEVTRREVRTEDVTDQVVDVEARLASQRAGVDRVRALLERAGSTAEITQVEGELTRRQSELESLQRRYDALKGQVALSTLTISISRAEATAGPVAEDRPDFLTALAGGWGALVDVAALLLAALGAVLPFAVVLGVPGGVWLWLRRKRKAATTG